MHRSVLTNASFVAFANESLVPFVAHDEMDHEEKREPGTGGEEVRRCTLYPGLACRDHLDAAVDVDNARGEGLVKVPFISLCPNTWLVLPPDTVEQVPEEVQFVAKQLREHVEAAQKRLGKPLPAKAFERLAPLLARAATAVEDERWKDALTDLAAVEAEVKEPSAALASVIRTHLDQVETDASFAFEDARDDRALTAADRRAAIEKVRGALDRPVLGKRLPTFDAATAWLAANPAPGG